MKAGVVLSSVAILAAAVALDALAQPGGGGGTKVCWFTDSTGHQFSRTCELDPANDCEFWYPVHPSETHGAEQCTHSYDRYAACMEVCNSNGDVVDGQCVCGCLDSDPPVWEDCVVNP